MYFSFFQVCCDYILAFAALGVAGLQKRSTDCLKVISRQFGKRCVSRTWGIFVLDGLHAR